jgi:inosine-uridine nucleoside N-ribohydrolase
MAAASLLLFVQPFAQPGLAQPQPKRLVVIDQDADGPGDSSMESMLMMLQDPTVQVLGITIESGDGWQRECVAHTLRMLELIGRTDIPVVPGATYPLVNSQAASRRWEQLYGHWGYKGAWTESWPSDNTVDRITPHGPEVVPPLREGDPHTLPAKETAANFLVRMAREHPGQVNLIALGPVTNLALAIRLEDGFAPAIRELTLMGGSFNPPLEHADEFNNQLLDSPRMAFNFRWDPEAASIVLHSAFPRIVAVSEDATTTLRVTPELMAEIARAANTSPAAAYIAHWGRIGFPLWDDIAAAVFLDPTLATRTRKLAMDVDLDRGANYGATLSWTAESQPHLGEQTVTVVLAVDEARTRAAFLQHITSPPPPRF